MTRCLYSRGEHTPEKNPEGGFNYCAECGEILNTFDEDKSKIWFSNTTKTSKVVK